MRYVLKGGNMDINVLDYIITFWVGGAICALAQILVVRTNITTSRILVLFLSIGIILQKSVAKHGGAVNTAFG